jgi:1-acyl-sn-glycerol-3-phosphate acyltransferase
MKAISELLARGEKILIYPEQGLWWNYKKPRPLKDGAFSMASRNNVPIIPVFITMDDGDALDPNGFPVQEYTLHFLPPIYPDENKNRKENTNAMRDKNFELWREVYESFYKKELTY